MSAVYSYVPKDHPLMAVAEQTARQHSTDHYHPTGAVVVQAGEIIGRGANQARIHHPRLAEWHRRGRCLRRLLRIKSGTHYWICPACSPARDHAEQRAVRDALKNKSGSLAQADLYLWGHWWCCQPCWSAMIRAGINEVFLLEQSEILFSHETHRKN